jgi:aldose 1-epimerase
LLRETTPVTGEQYFLELATPAGNFQATIAQVGASLRALRFNDLDLVETYDAEKPAPLCAGQIMSPWVNRLDGGTWNFNGTELTNPINISQQQNANHGLLLDYSYEVVSKDESSVTLRADIDSPSGYPFEVETFVEYRLVANGLRVTHRALNKSSETIPYATGAHPYFKISNVDTGELTVTFDAGKRTVVNERQIPTEVAATAGTVFDLSQGKQVKAHFFDDDFTDLPLDAAGNSHCYLKSPNGHTLDIWQDSNFKHLVIFTPDFFPNIHGEKVYAIGVEPATSPPNALNSQVDLIWLKPGIEFSAAWGVNLN